jgi:hypothetical protein
MPLQLIADLQKLHAPWSTSVPAAAPPAAAAKTGTSPAAAKDPNRINVLIPRKWMLRSGLPDHPFVIIVFDPQTDTQAEFALSAASATEMAAGLVKYADVLEKQEANKAG